MNTRNVLKLGELKSETELIDKEPEEKGYEI